MENLIQGFDNMALFIFTIIFIYIIYILYIIIDEILNQRNLLQQNLQNLYNLNNNLSNVPEDDCPICHEKLSNVTELECLHKFCARCIMEYYKVTTPLLNCPMCRKNIKSMKILYFDRTEEIKKYMEMIINFNHINLNGYNYVQIFFFKF